METSRALILEAICKIEPLDPQEVRDIRESFEWIRSGVEIYRRKKPDVPRKHLVSYFVPIDPGRGSLLLVDHINARLWLPPGGHIEPDEDPYQTVVRELEEELGVGAGAVEIDRWPLLLTANTTRGAGPHVDVSLWYAVSGSESMPIKPAADEFRGYHWQSYEEVLSTPISQLDPQMHRFVRKIKARL
jgi:8-oxo-dGTP pyrophosphatase MutT (NUDIX family)